LYYISTFALRDSTFSLNLELQRIHKIDVVIQTFLELETYVWQYVNILVIICHLLRHIIL
jgi:hypothetical protein